MDELHVSLPLTDEAINSFLAQPIYHPSFNKAFKFISKAYRSFGRVPNSCYILGDSGVGKTMLANTVKQAILKKEEQVEFANSVPVILITLQESALPDAVKRDILSELDVDYSSHAGDALQKLLLKQLKICKVKLVIFDEFQHLLRMRDKDVNKKACEFIKTFINETNIPVVLLGTPRGHKLFKLHDELRTRFTSAGELHPMSCDNQTSLEYLRTYLEALMVRCPIKTVDISKGNIPYRVQLATHGNLRTLEKLLSEVLSENRTGEKKLTLKDYQEAYEYTRQEPIFTRRGREIKPFVDDISLIKNLVAPLEEEE